MDGSSYIDFIPATRRQPSALSGIVVGVFLSAILWLMIAALLRFVLRF